MANDPNQIVGSSGNLTSQGFKNRDGGIQRRIVEGKQFGKGRNISWLIKMKEDNIAQIIVKWYVTVNEDTLHIPLSVKGS